MDQLELARTTAVRYHKNLYGGGPYIVHLNEVLAVLLRYDPQASEDERLSAILHDILEDTDMPVETLRQTFGHAVTYIVMGVTDEPGTNRKERKTRTYPKIAVDERRVKVKLSDRIANWENCLKNNPGLLQMYRKEYPDFRAALWNPTHGPAVAAMWNHLDGLYKQP